MRLIIAACLAIAGLTSLGVSHASIPPPYALHIVSSENEARALGDALIQYMSTAGAFSRHPLAGGYQADACLAETGFEACARARVPARGHWQDPVPMIVRVEAAGTGRLLLTCVGSGAHRPPAVEQQVEIDAQTALFGEGDARHEQLRAALACLRSAALESSAP